LLEFSFYLTKKKQEIDLNYNMNKRRAKKEGNRLEKEGTNSLL